MANAINIMQIEDCSFSFGTVGRLLNHLVGLGRLRPFAFYQGTPKASAGWRSIEDATIHLATIHLAAVRLVTIPTPNASCR